MLTTKNAQTLRFEAMAREHVERLGQRIRERRLAMGLTQSQVAREMPPKVDSTAISRWERGEHKPSDDYLEKLADVLQTTMSKLLVDPPVGETPDLLGRTQLDRIEQKLDRTQNEAAAIRVELATLSVMQAELLRSLQPKPSTAASRTRSRKAK